MALMLPRMRLNSRLLTFRSRSGRRRISGTSSPSEPSIVSSRSGCGASDYGHVVSAAQGRAFVELFALDQLDEIGIFPQRREPVQQPEQFALLALGLAHVRFLRLRGRGDVLRQRRDRVLAGQTGTALSLSPVEAGVDDGADLGEVRTGDDPLVEGVHEHVLDL